MIQDEEAPHFKFLIIAGVIVVILLIIFAGLTFLAFKMVSDVDIDIRTITIDIDNRQCNVSAELDIDPDIEIGSENMRVIFETEEVPLGFNGDLAWVHVDEEKFTEIVEKEEIRIKGTVEAENLIGKSSDMDIDENIDLSFLGEILSGVSIMDAKLSTKFPFTAVVEFNLTVEMDRDVEIFANNTKAIIHNGANEQQVDLVSLNLYNNGSGNGRVEMPSSTLLTLALWGRNVTISSWGLEAEFTFPF